MPDVALVTGGAIRLGAAMAEALAARGMAVAIHYRGSGEAAGALKARIEDGGGTARVFQADLAVRGAADGLWDAVVDDLGAPRLLVNNASRFARDEAETFAEEDLAAHVAVNLTAPSVLARRLYATADDDGADRLVVNMLDAKLFQLNPDFFTYTLSKHALLGATRTMAIAFAPRVRVVGIAPSVTLISGKQSEETFRRSKVMTLMKRGPDPEDIVRALLFALDTPAITGEVIVLDGGQRLMNLPHDVAFYVKEGIL